VANPAAGKFCGECGPFDTAQTAIGRHGGVVEKFIGDAVMAVWGTR
jgi:class 3 adenylate cyclase